MACRLEFHRTVSHRFFRVFLRAEMPNRLPTLFVPSVADTTPRAWSFIKKIVDSVNCLTLCFSRDYTFTVSKYNLHSNLTDLCLPYPSTVPLLGTDRAKTFCDVREKCRYRPRRIHFSSNCTLTTCQLEHGSTSGNFCSLVSELPFK